MAGRHSLTRYQNATLTSRAWVAGYVTDVLTDAAENSKHAGKTSLDASDVLVATRLRDCQSTSQPSRDVRDRLSP